MSLRIYLQSSYLPDITLVEISDGVDAGTLKQACINVLPQSAQKHEFYLSEEGSEDDEITCQADDLDSTQGVRVHLSRCKHILVTVQFQGEAVTKKFRPSTTIGRVRKWAGKELGMDKEDVAEHILQLFGSDTQPDNDQHIGRFSCQESCSVGFDLVPCHRING